ncbi:MAG: dockerin type I repeat-containing protein, partial [Oscillospiraceae bacterium]|nr:dockerin type I repeat-containing protein [Oscillospiraceae bacterium]
GYYEAYVDTSVENALMSNVVPFTVKMAFPTPTIIKGDINNDGQLNTTDIIILQKWLLQGEIQLANWKAADINEDGILNIFDFCLMKRMLINS